MTKRTTLLACLLAMPLALAGCGTQNDESKTTNQESATESVSSSESGSESSSASESATESTDKKDKKDADKDSKKSDATAGEDAAKGKDPKPAPAAPPKQPAPAGNNQGGDEAQIRGVIDGIKSRSGSTRDYMIYSLENSCTRYLNENGGKKKLVENVDPAIQYAKTAGVSLKPEIRGVKKITVNGNVATADVDASVGGVAQKEPMRFEKENGTWKICPAPGSVPR